MNNRIATLVTVIITIKNSENWPEAFMVLLMGLLSRLQADVSY